MGSKYLYQRTIRNDYLQVSKTIKADSLWDLEMKVRDQLGRWGQQEQRQREAGASRAARAALSYQRQQLRDAVEQERQDAQAKSEVALAELAGCSDVLANALKHGYQLDWGSLESHELYPAFIFARTMPRFVLPDNPPSKVAVYTMLHVPRPRPLLEGVLPFLRKRREAAERRADHAFDEATQKYTQDRLVALRRHLALLLDYLAHKREAFNEYAKRRDAFEQEQASQNEAVGRLRTDYEAQLPGAVEQYIALALLKAGGAVPVKDCDVQVDPDSATAVIDYTLPGIDDLPKVVEYKYVASRRETQPVEMKRKEYDAFYEDVTLKLALKTMYQVFNAVQNGSIEAVVFNGWVHGVDKATGKDFTSCIISIRVARSEFMALDLSRVDPKECIRNLKGLVAGPLALLAPVRPIMNIDRSDRRFIESREVIEGIDASSNLAEMPWDDFEHLVRELFGSIFSADGQEVRVTQASRDGGVDAIAFDPDPIRGGKFVIQAKRYNAVVPVSAARDLYGTMINEGAVKGILVTTSYFGSDSRDFVKDKPITLIDGANLVHMFQDYGKNVNIRIRRRAGKDRAAN
jgi:restriction system protein